MPPPAPHAGRTTASRRFTRCVAVGAAVGALMLAALFVARHAAPPAGKIAAAPATRPVIAPSADRPGEDGRLTVRPREEPDALLHNPDMGWVLYENYALDPRPGGSSTLVTCPDDTFPGVDAVALMFAWSDVERREGEYDFSKANFAYDYWAARGKRIQLRMSTEPLLWWAKASPPSGLGVPNYVLDKLPADRKQTRTSEGIPYTVVDAREPYYLERLEKFLAATAANFSGRRPVTLVDLRGFGLWGEWHSGYRYPSEDDRRAALIGIVDRWSAAFKDNYLALSYSYDPDSPPRLYEGTTEGYDASKTRFYTEYLRCSAFAYALTKTNVTFRRDGAGGAVHSNERRLCKSAFATLEKGPMMSEFLGGYAATKKHGSRWQQFMLNDALSLHPNYVCLLGWQAADARDFIRERPDLFEQGLRSMGYRLVPVRVNYPAAITPDELFHFESEWVNRGVGRAMRDYHLRLSLAGAGTTTTSSFACDAGPLGTDKWVRDKTYPTTREAAFRGVPPGDYTLRLALTDPATQTTIALPLAGGGADGSYGLSTIKCEAERHRPSQ